MDVNSWHAALSRADASAPALGEKFCESAGFLNKSRSMNRPSETIPTTGGTNCASVAQTSPAAWPRTAVFVALFALSALCVGWISRNAWRQAGLLRNELAAIEAEGFYLGVHLRAGVWRLDARLLRFQLSDDPAEREGFQRESRGLFELLDSMSPHLTTHRERELAADIRQSLGSYTNQAAPLLEQGLRGIRRTTASQVAREIAALSTPLLALTEDLVKVQSAGWGALLLESQGALTTLQAWIQVSMILLAGLLILLLLLAYRSFVAPLRASLIESRTLIERQEKLASLGTLAAGVAHEIRNPLSAIKFRLYSLRQSLKGQSADTEDIGIIGGEIHRLERIVKDFLQFARPSEPVQRPVAVADVFREVAGLLHAQLAGEGSRLIVDDSDGLWIRADKGQLKQALINLVQNGAESAGRGGCVTLRARSDTRSVGDRTGSMVILEVADTGPGVPAEIEPRLFDPFFSTREGGTGLGLAIAARIVEKHGGRIHHQNQPAGGAVFSIELPGLRNDVIENTTDRG